MKSWSSARRKTCRCSAACSVTEPSGDCASPTRNRTSQRGLADAFRVGADFIAGQPVCLILGDNIFFGQGLPDVLRRAAALTEGALVFAYTVRDPERYGVVEFDANKKVLSLEEKPAHPRSHYAMPGIYFYNSQVVDSRVACGPPRAESWRSRT